MIMIRIIFAAALDPTLALAGLVWEARADDFFKDGAEEKTE